MQQVIFMAANEVFAGKTIVIDVHWLQFAKVTVVKALSRKEAKPT